jgi:hypothetical protein
MSSTEYLADSYGFTCSNKKFITVYISLLVFGIIMEFIMKGTKTSVSMNLNAPTMCLIYWL